MIPQCYKPLLAINQDKVKTQPVVRYCSEKLDGVRMSVFGGVGYSRTLKPIPNKQIQEYCKTYAEELEGFDGEVILGDLYAVDVLQKSTGFVMSEDKVSDYWTYYVFDKYDPDAAWLDRFIDIDVVGLEDHVKKLEHYYVRDGSKIPKELYGYTGLLPWVNLDWFEQQVLARGGEGVMIRDALGKYKHGRSGTRNPELQKVKRFEDMEALVVGYTQFETNQNELQRDERGYAKRSTAKDGKQLVEQLGSLVCRTEAGVEFSVGSGFTQAQRQELWYDRDSLLGKQAKIQYFGFSKDNVPLLPVFLAFRDERDM